jgi:hypothetical protein
MVLILMALSSAWLMVYWWAFEFMNYLMQNAKAITIMTEKTTGTRRVFYFSSESSWITSGSFSVTMTVCSVVYL